ncbi:hypothetical protein ISCGN_004589 [Ixodes scapularis]
METELTPRQRGRLLAKNSVASKQPRLPSDALKLIVRPRGGLQLFKISTYQLLEATCTAAHFTRDAVRHEDLILANLLQNTFAYCTPVVERAERVLRLKTIVVDNKTYEVSVYCVPDDSSGRGVIRGVDLRLDRDTIQAELQDNRNPPIVDFRRLRNTTAVLITFAQPQVPTWVYFCNSRHRCNLFKNNGSTLKEPRQTDSRPKSPTGGSRSNTPADGTGNAPIASRGSPGTDRALFHRSSLPLHGGGLKIPPGPDPSHLQASSRLGPLLNCCSHPSHHYQRQSNENVNNRPPRAHKDVFGPLFLKAEQRAQGQPLLILGDFNAHHRAWGCHYDSAKGRRLWDDWHTHQLSLITDVSYPTGLATGLHRDTTPDLAFTSSGVKATWCHTHENFGSDHFMLEIVIQEPTRQRTRPAQVIDWDSFRVHRQEQDTPPIITDIKAWTIQIVKQVAHATQTVQLEDTVPHCDRHYAHLWERKKSLEALLATRKWDRNIRRRLARANTTIENYAIELTRQSWHNICDQMNKTPNTRNTWKLLRHLLDPAGGKLQARQQLERIFHQYPGTPEELKREIIGTYIRPGPATTLPSYQGPDNPGLDAPITLAEVRAELNRLKTTSAAGPDRISNKMLRNLDDASIQALTDFLQECWYSCTIPQEWKCANLVLIPKPGKPPTLANLRPISLTSCVGKLMEHVIQIRLHRYLEDSHLLPDTMFGFRPHFAAPDIMLFLHHQVVMRRTLDTKFIVGLDVAKAFDNVLHEAILQQLQTLGVGHRTYTYIRDFLTGRTVQLSAGTGDPSIISPGNPGTPQGSMLSPTLFNVALIGLPKLLADIPHLHHSLYADDLTLWITRGSDGQIEETLQTAIDRIGDYLDTVGLTCSATKSEYIIIPSPGRRPPKILPELTLRVQGNCIPRTGHIRILGLHLQANGSNNISLQRIDQSAVQIGRLLKRVSNKHRGMRESNLLRLVQAFICSRITYSAPYLRLTRAESERLESSLRKAYKTALGLLIYPHCQYEWLSLTHAGRAVLQQVGILPTRAAPSYADLAPEYRQSLRIPPIPKRMHPEHHAERRADRARQLEKRFSGRPDVTYTDACCHHSKPAMVAVPLAPHRSWHTACSIRNAKTVTVAEEVAIALALTDPITEVVISDSQQAIRNYDAGRISRHASHILLSAPPSSSSRLLIWAPAHESLRGNAEAHTLARELSCRAERVTRLPAFADTNSSRALILTTYTDILQYYRLGRCTYPPAHRDLTRREAVQWRKLQTGSFPHPLLYNKIFPQQIAPRCKHCSAPGTLIHMVWTCTHYNADNLNTPETWESLLRTSEPEDQRRLIQRAVEAATSQGIAADLLSASATGPGTGPLCLWEK